MDKQEVIERSLKRYKQERDWFAFLLESAEMMDTPEGKLQVKLLRILLDSKQRVVDCAENGKPFVAACHPGGASLSGGVGTIPGAAFLGVLFMSLVQNALIIARVGVFWQSIVVGVVLLVAIGVDQLAQSNQ